MKKQTCALKQTLPLHCCSVDFTIASLNRWLNDSIYYKTNKLILIKAVRNIAAQIDNATPFNLCHAFQPLHPYATPTNPVTTACVTIVTPLPTTANPVTLEKI